MGSPRRRFPGGSVGQFFVIMPDFTPMTEDEALHEAVALTKVHNKRIYIAKYANHVDPEDIDAKR